MTPRDKYYSELSKVRDPAEAGWFEDSFGEEGPEYNLNWLCTSLSKVRRLIGDAHNPAVLLTTGGMAPVHIGHLEMMEKARLAAEEAGHTVVGGFIAPDHDEYTDQKLGSRMFPASIRVQLVAKATQNSIWLDVDPWAALHVSGSVNFTDVVERLRLYIRHHLGRDVTVIYVCGGDNARFASCFLKEGHCCVVSRPGGEGELEKSRIDPLNLGNSRILWAHSTLEASSTRVRGGDVSLMPAEIREEYSLPDSLFVRVESSEMAPLMSSASWVKFGGDIENLFIETFSGQVFMTKVASQRERVKKIHLGSNYISLDAMIPLKWNLSISRVFGLGGYKNLGHSERPGSPPISEQVQMIPPGEYTLFDDDTVSGGTFQAAEKILNAEGRVVCGTHALTSFTEDENREIVDLRDFAIGTVDGGLVAELPSGRKARVPYIFPFVDPTARASVPPEKGMAFSASVWGLNREFVTGSALRVSDLPREAQPAYAESGFCEEDLLEDVFRHFELTCRNLQ